MGKHALILGASGITGWAVVNELLSESRDAQQFDRVTALTVRPLDAQSARWPASDRLTIVSGIDLTRGTPDELAKILKEKVKGIGSVTHVFFHSRLCLLHHVYILRKRTAEANSSKTDQSSLLVR
jgi:nucleoside-diphosphate-sugar epimerase